MNNFTNSIYDKVSSGVFDATRLSSCNLISQISISIESNVYLFADESTNEKFTLKQVKNYHGYYTDETLNIIKGIAHPSIAEIVDIIREKDDLYIIKRYVEGVTLDELRIQRKILLDSDINFIMIKIATILEYLHGYNRLIHRDIKPSNLIFTPDGEIVLIDLMSIRSVKENQSQDTVYIGTSKYAAPEQFGYSQTDERTDVYNLGATMKSLLVDYNTNCKQKGIIEKCLSFDPKDRYQSIRELLDALEKIDEVKEEQKKPFKWILILSFILIASLAGYSFILSQSNERLKQENAAGVLPTKEVFYRNMSIMPEDWVHVVGSSDDPIYNETEEALGSSRRITAYGSSYASNMTWLEMTADVFIYSTYNPYDDLPGGIKALIDRETFNSIKSGDAVKLDYYSDSKKHMKILIVNPNL